MGPGLGGQQKPGRAALPGGVLVGPGSARSAVARPGTNLGGELVFSPKATKQVLTPNQGCDYVLKL